MLPAPDDNTRVFVASGSEVGKIVVRHAEPGLEPTTPIDQQLLLKQVVVDVLPAFIPDHDRATGRKPPDSAALAS